MLKCHSHPLFFRWPLTLLICLINAYVLLSNFHLRSWYIMISLYHEFHLMVLILLCNCFCLSTFSFIVSFDGKDYLFFMRKYNCFFYYEKNECLFFSFQLFIFFIVTLGVAIGSIKSISIQSIHYKIHLIHPLNNLFWKREESDVLYFEFQNKTTLTLIPVRLNIHHIRSSFI